MGVMMQTFHWDCPREDKKGFQWWNYINEKVVFNAGSLEKSIFMKMEDYFRIVNPQLVKIALRG